MKIDWAVPLSKCPFCNSDAELLDLGDSDSFYVHCVNCEVQQIANHTSPQAAADKWNRRAVNEEIDTLKIALDAPTDHEVKLRAENKKLRDEIAGIRAALPA